MIGIDAARQSAAPVLERLKDYDFRAKMKQAVTDATASLETVKLNGPMDIDTVVSDSDLRIRLNKSIASAVLFVGVKYRLQSGNLYIEANALMLPKSSKLQAFRKRPNDSDPLATGNAIYKRKFDYTKLNVRPDNVAGALNEGAASIATQLVADLNHPL